MNRSELDTEFKRTFKLYKLPHQDSEIGVMKFVRQNVRVTLDFNPEYFNFYPRIKIFIFEKELLAYGFKEDEQLTYDKITNNDEIIKALTDADMLVSIMNNYTRRLDLNTFDWRLARSNIKVLFNRCNFKNT